MKMCCSIIDVFTPKIFPVNIRLTFARSDWF